LENDSQLPGCGGSRRVVAVFAFPWTSESRLRPPQPDAEVRFSRV